MMEKYKSTLMGLFLLVYFLVPFPLSAGAPTDQVRSTVDKVLAILKNPPAKDRRAQLRQVIYSRFDFTEMAKRSLGSHWRRRTPEEQREFVEIFTDLLEDSYLGRIEAFTDEKYFFNRETLEKDYAEVDTKMVTKNGEWFSLRYKLHLVNGDWKVYDVIVENISLVNNYRSQFNRIIANSSYEELVRRLKEKQTELTK
ncbi:MAG: MlaC/ttg2D family ABC transporter substrate-binding protein [Candidatus Binatia bacterium]